MPARSESCAIAVMAKAPQSGRSKTRLVPPLTLDEAAALAAAFLHDITENLALAACMLPIKAYAAYAPAGDETRLDDHLAPGTRLILADASGPRADGVLGTARPCQRASYAGLPRRCWRRMTASRSARPPKAVIISWA